MLFSSVELQYQLRKASLSEGDAFAFLKGDNCDDLVTFCSFSEALRQVLYHPLINEDVKFQLHLTYCTRPVLQIKLIGGPYGLCFQELKDLWTEADIDGNGFLDFEKFKVYCIFIFWIIFCFHGIKIYPVKISECASMLIFLYGDQMKY